MYQYIFSNEGSLQNYQRHFRFFEVESQFFGFINCLSMKTKVSIMI